MTARSESRYPFHPLVDEQDQPIWKASAAVFGEETFDIAGRLPDALLVLHHRDADIALALFAKAHPCRHCDLGVLEQLLGEFEAAHVLEALG